ncbi:MAG TPA: PKD domain-containing protein, partial [Bacteroidales bacterium]|nr:PKD domain-containing protein [Bacteroidales bacterium]
NTFISAGADYTNNFMGTSISTDGGLNWNVIPLSDTTQFLTIDFVDVNHGWAGAFNTDSITGGMWKYTGNLFVQDPCAGLVALYVKSADTLDLNVFGVCDFTDLSSGSPSGWSWDFGDGGSANVQNPSHTYTATGTYDIELTVNRDTCVEVYTESIVVINTSGISTFSDGPAVEIWPNPATDYLHIASAAEVYRVEIYNSIGQTAINSLNNEKLLNINISDYLPGVYFVRITTSQGRTEGRFIITK